MAGKFEVEGIFKITDRMTRPVGKIESRIEAFQRRVAAGAGRVGQRMARMWDGATKGFEKLRQSASEPFAAIGRDMKTVGVAALAAGAAAGPGLVKVMQTGMTFEKTLLDAGNKFEPGINKASESFKRLSAAAQEVGGSTEFSASQSAMALNDLAGAGFNVEQAISGLPKVVNFATAASLDLSAASEVAAKSLGAFNMKSNDPKVLAANLQKVTDSLMKADALSSTDIPSLFEVIKEGGPIAAQAGVSLESFMAMAAALGEAGIEGSAGGTTLKNTIMTLAKATPEAEAALKRLGVSTKTAAGQLRDPIDSLADLKKATDKMQGAERIGVLEEIFGKIPLAGVSAMLGDVEKLANNRKGIVAGAGQVDVVAASKRQSTQGSWDNLTSGVEALSLAIFGIVGGPMNQLITSTTEWIGKFKDEAIPFVKTFVSALQSGFQAAWPAIKGAVDILFKGFGGKAEWLVTVKDFATLLGKVIAAAVGLATVLGGMVAAGLQIVTALVNEVIGAWNGMINGIGALIFAFDNFFANIGAKWRAFNFADWGMQIVKGIANGIKAGAQWVMDAVGNLADEMINKLKGALDMRSPSRRMNKEVGRPAAAGVGVGWVDEMENVNAQIEKSIEASPMVKPVVTQLPRINALSLGSDMESPELGPQLMSSEERIAGAAGGDLGHGEIVIRDETGRAEVSEQPKRTKLKIEPARSGQF